MKKAAVCVFVLLFGIQSIAAMVPAVQRTMTSSYLEYKKYLRQIRASSFVDSYIQLSSVTVMETPLLERCLEELYLGAPSAGTCLEAVKSLVAKPLNQPRREVLFSFLLKLEKTKSPQKSLYQSLIQGLLKTHPRLALTFHTTRPPTSSARHDVQVLEMKAWKKALAKIFPLEEVALLVNGTRVANLAGWSAPQGVYQWSLISNTHEPLVRLGTFSQFAAESLKNLKPLAAVDCLGLKSFEPQKFGLLKLEVFSDRNCSVSYELKTTAGKSEHLGPAEAMVKMDASRSRSWIWAGLAALTLGIAMSLKNKQVSLQMPGAN